MKLELCALLGFFLLSPSLAAADDAVDRLGDPLPKGAIQRLGTLRLRYGGVGGLAYLQDGSAVILNGGYVDIWNMQKGEHLSRTKVSDANLVSVQLRSDGKTLLLGDSAGKVREWDAVRMVEVRAWDTGLTGLRSAQYSSNEKRMLIGADDPPRLAEWDIEGNKKLIGIKSQMATSRCGAIYGPNGKTAIMGGGFEHNLEHYDLATGKLLKKWCTVYEAKHMALSPDQKYVTVGLEDCAIEWSLENYKIFRIYKHCPGEAARIFWVAYLPKTNEVLCAGRDGSIHRWNRQTGKLVLSIKPHQGEVAPMCVSPDQKWVLSYGSGEVSETNIATGQPRLNWPRHNGAVQAVAFLPNGAQAVSASSDATLRVWDLKSGDTVRVITGATHGAYALDVASDGNRVAAGCKDGKIREFSLSNGAMLRELAGHLGFIRSVKYTHAGDRLLSSADDGTIRIWGAGQGNALARLEGHRGGVLSIAVSPDDKFILSCGRDATVRVWNLANGKLLRVMEGHRGWVECVAFTPDGKRALSAGRDGRLLQWDIESGNLIVQTPSVGWIHALACSPDGSRAFVGSGVHIYGWDLKTGQPSDPFSSTAAVLAIALSPDGTRLLAGYADTTLLLWQLE